MGIVAFFALIAALLLADALSLRGRKLRIIDLISWLLLVGISAIGGHIFMSHYGMYYYVNPDENFLFAVGYHALVYPSFGLMYSVFFPTPATILRVCWYNVLWTAGLFLLEILYVQPFGVIVYTKWRVFPDSVYFYLICLTLYSLLYIAIRKWIKALPR